MYVLISGQIIISDIASAFHWETRRVLFRRPGTPEATSAERRGSALTLSFAEQRRSRSKPSVATCSAGHYGS